MENAIIKRCPNSFCSFGYLLFTAIKSSSKIIDEIRKAFNLPSADIFYTLNTERSFEVDFFIFNSTFETRHHLIILSLIKSKLLFKKAVS